ncbi:MAG: hypothetical protein LBN23_05495, partial [Paludibacter sp.]|jgi:peptidoglycan hydrolase CwlO-like protein|nr:hypothetical protein [Paludibacter sp.]
LVSTGNENFVSPVNDAEIFDKMKSFLTTFSAYLREYDLNLKIAEQKGILNNLDKEHGKMVSDIEKWRKQIADLQASTAKREKEIDTKKAEIEQVKAKIQDLSNSLQTAAPVQVDSAPVQVIVPAAQ